MTDTPIVLLQHQSERISTLLDRLRLDAIARIVFLIDKNGQQIAVEGETRGLDTTSLASLAAGNVAATGSMALLIGEKEFPTLSHEGEREGIHICVVGRTLLVVIFDQRSSLGLVKLRAKQVSRELSTIIAEISEDSKSKGQDDSFFDDITDSDIESLFS